MNVVVCYFSYFSFLFHCSFVEEKNSQTRRVIKSKAKAYLAYVEPLLVAQRSMGSFFKDKKTRPIIQMIGRGQTRYHLSSVHNKMHPHGNLKLPCSVTGAPVGFSANAFSHCSGATSRFLAYALTPAVRSLKAGWPLLLSVIAFKVCAASQGKPHKQYSTRFLICQHLIIYRSAARHCLWCVFLFRFLHYFVANYTTMQGFCRIFDAILQNLQIALAFCAKQWYYIDT